jgi:hypothetical protein
VRKTLPIYEAALAKLEALQPPAHDELSVRQWLGMNERIVKAERTLAVRAQRHDGPGVQQSSASIQSLGLASRNAAADLDMKVCATAR